MFTVEDYKLMDKMVNQAIDLNDVDTFFELITLRSKIAIQILKNEEQIDLLIEYLNTHIKA